MVRPACTFAAAALKIALFMQPEADITVVVTSCNRHDLLARTLASFKAQETEGRVARILVAEDGDGDPSAERDQADAGGRVDEMTKSSGDGDACDPNDRRNDQGRDDVPCARL